MTIALTCFAALALILAHQMIAGRVWWRLAGAVAGRALGDAAVLANTQGSRGTALDPLALALLFAVLISLTGVMASAALWMLGAIFLWAFVPRFTARSPA